MSTYVNNTSQANTNAYNNSHDTAEYINKKILEKKLTAAQLNRDADVRDTTITQPSQSPSSQQQSGNAGQSEFDFIMAALKDSHNILDEVLLVMILATNNTGDSASRIARELQSVVQASKNLKMAADALDAYNKYIAAQKAAGEQYNPMPISDLDDPAKGLQALKAAISSADLGGWTEESGKSVEQGIQDMGTILETNDMVKIDNKSSTTILDADIQVILDGTVDPTSAVTDMYNVMTNSSQNATNVNATKSTTLQGLTNNYQMTLSMAVSMLQRAQDLNSKITSLT